jgi:hypothetical protein
LLDDRVKLVTLMGKAGTGKTLMAMAAGLKRTVLDREFRRLVVARPTVSMGRELGFLPGSLEEKLNPWMQPIHDALELLSDLNMGSDHRRSTDLMRSGTIVVEALSYIRGRSIAHQFMVIDEAQNLTPLEVKTIITRVGPGPRSFSRATRIRSTIRMWIRPPTASTTSSANSATSPSPRTSSCKKASARNWRNWRPIFCTLPVTILLTSRCARWGTLPIRLLMAAVYLALPNAGEIHVVLANAQWHLCLTACLLVLANPPVHWGWKVFDIVVLLLCGLTGPYCLLLLPVAAIFWWKRRQSWSGIVCGLLAITSALEAWTLLRGGWQQRILTPLGATPLLFAKILAGQVYVGALIGQNDFASRANLAAVVAASLIGSVILCWCLFKSGWEMRLFILFSAMLLAAALRSPLAAGRQRQWEFLATSTGGRYWFFPMLAFSWSLIWCATQSACKPCQILGAFFLAAMLWGEMRDWKYPPFPDKHFPQYVNKFDAAPPGTTITIPICPEGCDMRLIKKG